MNIDKINEIVEKGGGLFLDECQFLSKTANEIKPMTVVEIGSSKGTSSMILGSVVRKTGGHLYCIDPNINEEWEQNIKDLRLTEYITLIEEASPWVNPEKFKQPIDYLLIDANHKTRWIIVDYHFWERFLRVGGRVAF
ncbi:MAG: class I SAM-dependent methyltransferase, partial [Promethearchaeota archaeon]